MKIAAYVFWFFCCLSSFTLFSYAPNITWYVDTINDVIQAADSPVTPDVMHGLFKVISAG